MGYSYLNGETWEAITRDERFFCAHLYFELKRDIAPLLQLILENQKKEFITKDEVNSTLWEVGYEVCFYRDFIYKFGHNSIHEITKVEGGYEKLGKRTFDLCLFSETNIIIIEAKAQQGFDNKQMGYFTSDIELMSSLVGDKVNISLVGLASSNYRPKEDTKDKFYALINWQQLSEKYDNDLFLKADNAYGK